MIFKDISVKVIYDNRRSVLKRYHMKGYLLL